MAHPGVWVAQDFCVGVTLVEELVFVTGGECDWLSAGGRGVEMEAVVLPELDVR